LELSGDIPDHAVEIASVKCGDIVASRPADSPCNPSVGLGRGEALGVAHEIAEPSVGSKTHYEMHVVG